MNNKQFNNIVEYLKEFSPFDNEEERIEDATAGAMAIDEILRLNADE